MSAVGAQKVFRLSPGKAGSFSVSVAQHHLKTIELFGAVMVFGSVQSGDLFSGLLMCRSIEEQQLKSWQRLRLCSRRDKNDPRNHANRVIPLRVFHGSVFF